MHVKASLLSREPFNAQGTVAFPVKKKGKVTYTVFDDRSVMLQNFFTKVHHAFLRTRLYALVHAALHVTQTGGIKGRGTDFSAALMRWSMQAYAAYKSSFLEFCVDIRSAFYSMLRQAVMPIATSQDDLDTIINRIGVPQAFVQPLTRLL